MKTCSVRALKITTLAENSAQSVLLGQWGLSFLLELVDGKGDDRKVVFDTGMNKRALLHNIKSLEMNLASLRNRLDVVVKVEGEMRDQLNALQSEVAQLTSTLDMISGGFGPGRPSKEARKSVLAATKKLAKECATEK
jgi:regulator of replication initiation timing